MARLGLLTAHRIRDRTSASSWRSASTQRRRSKRPDAHGDVVGALLACHVRYTPWRGYLPTIPGEGCQAVHGATVSLCRLALAPPGIRMQAQRLLAYEG